MLEVGSLNLQIGSCIFFPPPSLTLCAKHCGLPTHACLVTLVGQPTQSNVADEALTSVPGHSTPSPAITNLMNAAAWSYKLAPNRTIPRPAKPHSLKLGIQ